MKLMSKSTHQAFALPTILVVATAMLMILMVAIAGAASSRVALDSQYYNQLANQAIESGITRAKECLAKSGYNPQWETASTNEALRPNTSCTGTPTFSSNYVVGDSAGTNGIRTTYSIDASPQDGIGSMLKIVGKTELVRTSTGDTWREYEQVAYYRIESPEQVACPKGFVSVPGNPLFSVDDFCVGKYETKNVNGFAVSQPAGDPYVNIDQDQAIAAAAAACNGCHIVTDAEWLTIAHNVVNVDSNWSGGQVGVGYIYSGHNDDNPSGPLDASEDDSNGYYRTGNLTGNQRRTLTLNNGEVIWDLAGNIWDRTDGTVAGGTQPGAPGYAIRDWNDVIGTGSISPNPFPSYGTPAAINWDSAQGIGRITSSTTETGPKAIMRGDFYKGFQHAAIFGMYLVYDHDFKDAGIGFRLAFTP